MFERLTDGKKIWFANLHGPLGKALHGGGNEFSDTPLDADAVLKAMRDHKKDSFVQILVGDFNANYHSPAVKKLRSEQFDLVSMSIDIFIFFCVNLT